MIWLSSRQFILCRTYSWRKNSTMCKKYVTSVLGLILMLVYYTDGMTVTIGVISCPSDVQESQKNTVVQIERLQATLTWLSVDKTEPFSLLSTVRLFVEEKHYDIIAIFCDEVSKYDIQSLIPSYSTSVLNLGIVPVQFKAGDFRGSEMHDTNVFTDNITTREIQEELSCVIESDHLDDHVTSKLTLPISMSSVVVRIINHLNWKSILLLHDNYTVWEAKALIDQLSHNGIMVAIYNLDIIENLHVLLKQIYDVMVKTSTEIKFIVHCRHYNLQRTFSVANAFDRKNNQTTALRHFSRWLVLVYDHVPALSAALKFWAQSLDNVLLIPFPEFKPVLLTQALPPLIKNILLDLHIQGIENGTTAEFITEMVDRLNESAFSIHPISGCKAFQIDTLLWTTEGRSFSSVGYVTSSTDVFIFTKLFPNLFFGFNKRRFLISTLVYPPYVMKKTVNHTDTYYGLCMDLLEEFARTLNFTYELIEPDDQKFGLLENDNISFNGLIGQLQRREVDLVVAPVSIHPERALAADFSYPFYYDYTSLLVRKPDPNSVKWLTLVYPFKWEVLVCIGFALIGVTVLTYLVEKHGPYYRVLEHAQGRDRTGGLNTIHDAFWYVYGALLCQGGAHLPDSIAGRTIISCWWLFSMVIVGTYCGNLIAFLTVTKYNPPFNTVKEMLQLRDDYKWGTLGGTIWELIFTQTSKRSEFIEIGYWMVEFNKSDPSVLSMDENVHIQKVKEGGYAFLVDTTIIDNVIAKECELMTIKEKFLPSYYGIGFPKQSPIVNIFSNQIIYIDERGLIQVWKRKWWPKANLCSKLLATQAKPIELTDVQSAFYVCLIGIFLGTVALAIEGILYKCRQYRKRELGSSMTNAAGVAQQAHDVVTTSN